MHLRPLVLGICLLVVRGQTAAAQEADAVVVPGVSRPTGTRLDEARKLLAAKKSEEAVALLQGILETAGNDLVQLADGRSVRSRWLCQTLLAQLDAEALALYRKKAEPAVRRILEGSGDQTARLHRIVDDFFCTRDAVSALDQLGDRAFERGRFEEAEQYWGLIAPLDPVPAGERGTATLRFPDPSPEMTARSGAKQLLARLFRGRAGWEDDLKGFRLRHGKATGKLAGRSGLYGDILRAVADARARAAFPREQDWPTFAGSVSRNRIVPAGARYVEHLARLCRGGPAWNIDLGWSGKEGEPLPPPRKGEEIDAARRLGFYPIVIGHLALVSDAHSIHAIDLRSGQVSLWYDLTRFVGGLRRAGSLPGVPDLRHSLTAAEGCIFARLGSMAIKDARPEPRRPGFPLAALDNAESALVCLSMTPGVGGDRRRWMVRAIDPGRKEYAVFEGAPLVQAGRVFIAATRFEGDTVLTAIHCYPAHPEDTAPAPLWRVDVCQTRALLPAGVGGMGEAVRRQQRFRHHLLTLAGDRLVYCSHSGVIAAIDPRTGQRDWAFRYQRRDVREPEDEPSLRDLAPPVFADGRLYVAPSDSDRLYCLDPLTGAVIWERERLDVVHLLGVGSGRLIFTTWRNPQLGRLDAGGLRAVRARDGSDVGGWVLPDDGGGLVPYGRGLLVGDLVLWPTTRQPFGVFAVRQVDGKQADNPTLLHRIPAGNLVWANGCLLVTGRRTLRAFVPPGWIPLDDEKPMGASIREDWRAARAAADRGEDERALERFRALIDRLNASGTRSDRTTLARVRRDFREMLLEQGDRALKAGDLAGADARYRRAATGPAEEALPALVHAANAWSHAKAPGRSCVIWEAIVRSNLRERTVEVDGVPQRAGWLAGRHLGSEPLSALEGTRPIDGCRAALRRLAGGVQGEARAMALAEVAAAWERLACPRAARLVRPIGDRAPLDAKVPSSSDLSLPLVTEGTWTLSAGERFLPVEGVEGAGAAPVLSCRDREVVCRDRADGGVRWRRALGFSVSRALGLGTVLVVGGTQGLAALDVLSGESFWSLVLPESDAGGDLYRVGALVVVGQGGRRLMGVEILTGAVCWVHEAPGAAFGMPAPRGTIHHVVPVDERFLLVQASGRTHRIEVATGRMEPVGTAILAPWPRPPLVLPGARVLLVPDNRRVQMFDVEAGKARWTHLLPGKTTRSGDPPLVAVSTNALVVIEPLNIACRLRRLDPESGRSLWGRPPLVALDRLEPDAWRIHGETLYNADAGRLFRRSLEDGRLLGERMLGAGPHRLHLRGDVLLAWRSREPAAQFRFRWLTGTLQWRLGPLPADGRASVDCLDARTGELVQRLNLAIDHTILERETRGERGGVFPRAAMGRDPVGMSGMVIQFEPEGLVLGLGRSLQAFRVDRSPVTK